MADETPDQHESTGPSGHRTDSATVEEVPFPFSRAWRRAGKLARAALAAPAITVIATAGVTLLAVDLSNRASVRQQRREFHEQRLTEIRTKRAAVYAEFLDASNAYATDVLRVFRTCKVKTDTGCRLGNGRFRYQGAVNDVYIYGSARARRAQQEMSRTLPPSLGSFAPEPKFRLTRIDNASFRRAYNAFLRVMRQEVRPQP